MQSPTTYDVVIIGCGVAGLVTALRLDPRLKVALISKNTIRAGSSTAAQGGIAAVIDPHLDSVEKHLNDTLVAGTGLCHRERARKIIEHGDHAIQWLVDQGVPFTRSEENAHGFHLTREGGHSERRVIHAADSTGKAVVETLIDQVRQRGNIDVLEHHLVIDLVTAAKLGFDQQRCIGTYVLNIRSDNVQPLKTDNVVLASGGASKAYLFTSNCDGSTGDGIAMAWRAGCRVANMEFNQFHPTCLYHPAAKSFLITEAVRGEGGKLLTPSGSAFMKLYDDRLELAPRDIVARAIDHEMKKLGADCLYLDISHKPRAFILNHFPTIHEHLLGFGIDMTREPIPVVPAAHYTCGGIVTNEQCQTDLPGLYAIGECAFTGLHGANRLASNSLLECLVTATNAAEQINHATVTGSPTFDIPDWDESQVTDSDEKVVISHNWEELRRFMWDYVGIVRTDKRLLRAKHRSQLLQQEIEEFYSNFRICSDLIELRNLSLVASLIIECALTRKESRGLHYNLDYPNLSPKTTDTILTPENFLRNLQTT